MIIKDATFSSERALYNLSDCSLERVSFTNSDEAESPLKECSNLSIKDCIFDLRYSCWHDSDVTFVSTIFTNKCRAPLWYCNDIKMQNLRIEGVKAIRESSNVLIKESSIESDEFAWKSSYITILNCSILGFYAFLLCHKLYLENVSFKGKYSFQYVENLEIHKSFLDTKDAFWHSKNVKVYDSTIKGEYLAWYSTNLTLIRCHIISHQPLCYCKNLVLIDCTTEGCDLAFEYSEVNAKINGGIDSIKNPLSGIIKANSIKEIIKENSKHPCDAKIEIY